MKNNEKIEKHDIEALIELNKQFTKWLNKNKATAELLKLRNKFGGTLGEAEAIVKLYKTIHRNRSNIEWRGVNKRGSDIVIKTEKKEIKIQIKTTTDGKNVHLFVSKIKNGKTLRNKTLNSDAKNKIIEEVGRQAKGKADYWIIVDIHCNKPNFFVLTEKQIISLLKAHENNYHNNIKHKNKNYHNGINKNGTIMHIIKMKELRKYKESKKRWKVMSKIS